MLDTRRSREFERDRSEERGGERDREPLYNFLTFLPPMRRDATPLAEQAALEGADPSAPAARPPAKYLGGELRVRSDVGSTSVSLAFAAPAGADASELVCWLSPRACLCCRSTTRRIVRPLKMNVGTTLSESLPPHHAPEIQEHPTIEKALARRAGACSRSAVRCHVMSCHVRAGRKKESRLSSPATVSHRTTFLPLLPHTIQRDSFPTPRPTSTHPPADRNQAHFPSYIVSQVGFSCRILVFLLRDSAAKFSRVVVSTPILSF